MIINGMDGNTMQLQIPLRPTIAPAECRSELMHNFDIYDKAGNRVLVAEHTCSFARKMAQDRVRSVR
jgi:hypothetical protein